MRFVCFAACFSASESNIIYVVFISSIWMCECLTHAEQKQSANTLLIKIHVHALVTCYNFRLFMTKLRSTYHLYSIDVILYLTEVKLCIHGIEANELRCKLNQCSQM